MAIDVFCGVGGLTYGFQSAGLQVIAGLDFDKSCKYAFEHNNKTKFLHKDVTNLNYKEIKNLYPKDSIKILVGCAPCQPFSKVPGEREDKDDKWRLLYSFSQLIEQVNPAIISMENVPQLSSHKKGKILNDFITKLEQIGYFVSKYKVNAANYGVPQRRNRLILFASKFGKIEFKDETHNKTNFLTVAAAIKELPALRSGETSKKDALHRARELSPINLRRIQATPEGGSWTDWPEELLVGLNCRKTKNGKTFKSAYGRMSWNLPSPTLTTHCIGLSNGCYGHPEQDRAISLREAALLQTFPAKYSFLKKGEQMNVGVVSRHIGNAVPPKLGEAIAESILNHLHEKEAYVG